MSVRFFNLCWFIGLGLVVLVLYLSLMQSPPNIKGIPFIDKLEHMLAYGILMGWYCQLYITNKSRVILAALFCLMGVAVEIIQGFSGYRFFEFTDMLANAFGVFLGWWISSRCCSGWLARLDQNLFQS